MRGVGSQFVVVVTLTSRLNSFGNSVPCRVARDFSEALPLDLVRAIQVRCSLGQRVAGIAGKARAKRVEHRFSLKTEVGRERTQRAQRRTA